MVEKLTDDALDVIVDVMMATQMRQARRLKGARQYWLDVTQDWWWEWCDRCSYEHGEVGVDSATKPS